jgi:hypothetical protein
VYACERQFDEVSENIGAILEENQYDKMALVQEAQYVI